jgi:Acetyl-CoA carboxylase, carboxyltransferase component (subunits alpha and beta)
MNKTYEDIAAKKLIIQMGDEKLQAQQKKDGKLTARERAAKLLDAGSFVEMDALAASGALTGYGTVQGRPVYLFAQDFTCRGGAMNETQAKKILKVLDLARKNGAPVVAMLDTEGICLDEGIAPLTGYARVLAQMARMSGVCPMIALVLGKCIGIPALMCEIADIAIMAKDVGALAAFGPQVLASANGTEVDLKKSAGAETMAAQGAVSLVADNEEEAFALLKTALDLLPSSNLEDADIVDADDMNRSTAAVDADDAYALLNELFDNGSFLELGALYGKAMVTALGRMGGRTVAVVATNKKAAPLLCKKSLKKAARFVRMADCYHIPVITLANTAGLKVPCAEKQQALLAASAALVYAYAEATTAKMTVVTGDAIGQAYVLLCGGMADISYAWPNATVSALEADAAAQLLMKTELDKSKEDASVALEDVAKKYAAEQASALAAAEKGLVDDVIDPDMTRQLLIANLEMLSSKRDASFPKKHGNLPL